ncbi:MAG: murein biosynthesis integral membrane protein MurJ [Bdellovibrionales bacterium]|nr:murein biosynthesis integral membrane protein MurJ [Bdellovibrionales bacterium]
MGLQDLRGVSQPPRKDGVLRAAGAMGAAVAISRVLGLVREQVFAYLFGASHAMDAFNIAFKIPNLFRNLFAEGAMSASFIPVLVKSREQEGEARAYRLTRRVLRVLCWGGIIAAGLGALCAPFLVDALASGYRAVPGKWELTVALTRIMFFFLPLVSLAAAYMGFLNSWGVYFLPALASALFNAASIASGVLLAWWLPRYGFAPIEGMAYGVVIGGAAQAFCQLPALRRAGYRPLPPTQADGVWHQDPGLRRMLALMAPATLGMAATQVNTVVNAILASGQGEGAVSWLNYAFRLMQLPIGIFGVSMATALLPEVSRLWVRKDPEGIERSLQSSLRHVLALNLPAAAGLAFLSGPIIQLIFEYGRFSPADTAATAQALAAYAAGLVFYSLVKILVPVFYGMENTRVPVVSSGLSIAANAVLNVALVGHFGFWALALGTSLAALLNSLYLLWAARAQLRAAGGRFNPFSLLGPFLLHGMIACAMGAVCWATQDWLAGVLPDSLLAEWVGKAGVPLIRALRVGFLVVEGIAVVWIFAAIFRVRETLEVLHWVQTRLTRRPKPSGR